MKAWIYGIIIAVVVLGAGYWLWHGSSSGAALSDDGTPSAVDQQDDSSRQHSSQTTEQSGGMVSGSAGATLSGSVSTGKTVTVTYDGRSFTPQAVTIAKGDTVKWVSTAGDMWVASAPHPAHTGYDGTTRAEHCAVGYSGPPPFDQCAAGTRYSFTFGKRGAWGYHDHLSAQATGEVIVQ